MKAAPPVDAMKSLQLEYGVSEIDKRYPTGGFKSLGHFCHTLARARADNDFGAIKALDEWGDVAAKAATGLGIRLDNLADVFVPVEFSQSIYARMLGIETSLMSRVRKQTIRGNSIVMHAEDDYDRSDDAIRHGGVTVAWVDEGDEIPKTKPDRTRRIKFNLHKLASLVYVSSEMLADSERAVDEYLEDRVPRAIDWEANRVIFEGSGAGQPLGAYRDTSTGPVVVVDKDAGQADKTISRANLSALYHAVPPSHRPRAVWHVNSEVEEDLESLTIGDTPVMLPPNGLADAPYQRLKGRPVIPLEFCETIGNKTDITFQDWDAYQVVFKGQTRQDISMHAAFERDEAAFRFVFRVDGHPLWNKPVTPYRGTRLTSPFATLAARAS